MSDQPENTEADTTEFTPVEPAPVAAPEATQAPAVARSNRRVIWAAVVGAGAVLLLVLAGLVGFALGSHENDHERGDFGPHRVGQMMQDFDGDRGGMMGQFDQSQPGMGREFGGPMMGHQDGPEGAPIAPQTQQ